MRKGGPYSRIKVEPTSGHLGAEVTGVDLSKPLDAATLAEIKAAWYDNLVLFFRDQKITPPIIESLAHHFGKPTITSYTNPVPGFKFAHALVREASAPMGAKNFGDMWHMDQTVRPIPTGAFLLYSVDCPPYGGDTGFASMYAAYEGLSEGMQKLCETLVAVHSPSGLYGDGKGTGGKRPFRLEGTDKAYTISDEQISTYLRQETEHPLVAVHPVTGRKLLMITGYVIRFRGMTEMESQPIIDYLMRHANKPDYTTRLRWRQGTLALLDNRCLQHIAYQDYTGHRREMLRCECMADEAPFGPAKPRQAAAQAVAA
ncbi:MAG TPA: TauD/TfdA family dioxygenase [Burkholderiales bacterium]|nr:TauD/TfdA family dioxygenase [Burkholderiales bacterium]